MVAGTNRLGIYQDPGPFVFPEQQLKVDDWTITAYNMITAYDRKK